MCNFGYKLNLSTTFFTCSSGRRSTVHSGPIGIEALEFRVPYLEIFMHHLLGLRFNPSPDQNEFVWGPNKRTKLNMQYSCINRKKVVLFFNYNHNPFRLVQHTIEKSWNIILGYINWGTLNDTNTACGMTGSTTFGMGFQPTSPRKVTLNDPHNKGLIEGLFTSNNHVHEG